MKKYKRRKYLINKSVQFAYAGITIWLLLIATILVGTITYYLTLNTILTQIEAEKQLIDAYAIVKNINLLLGKRIGILLGFIVIFTLILEILFLHRVAGPIYRIEKTLKDLAEGKQVNKIKLRKKDFFKSLAETTNQVIDAFQKNVKYDLEI